MTSRRISTLPKREIKAVIFGGAGYIGRPLTRELLRQVPNLRVTVAGRRSQLSDGGSLEYVKCDVADLEQVKAISSNADLLINLVGIMDEEPPRRTFKALHVDAAIAMAKSVAERVEQGHDARFIHISAIGANPNSSIAYAKSKGNAEVGIKDAFKGIKRGLSSMIIRPGLVISREDQFLNRFATLTKYLPVFPIFGSGSSKYQPIHRPDLVQVIINACILDSANCSQVAIVEVGGKNSYAFKDIVYATSRKSKYPNFMRMFIPPLFIHVPVSVAIVQGWLFEKIFPIGSPLRISRAQIKQLQLDNIVSPDPSTGALRTIAVKMDSGDTNLVEQELARGVAFTAMHELFQSGLWINKQ